MALVDINTCPDVREHKYIISQSHLRLLNGDACANVSRVINDTDGRGHSTLPGRGVHLPPWAVVVIALLVSPHHSTPIHHRSEQFTLQGRLSACLQETLTTNDIACSGFKSATWDSASSCEIVGLERPKGSY